MKKNKDKITKRSKRQETRDQFTVVLESIESKVDAITEGVVMANEKMDRGFKEVDKKFREANENMRLMRTEISLIRHNQITRDEFKALENRVFTIEKKIAK